MFHTFNTAGATKRKAPEPQVSTYKAHDFKR